MSVLIYIESVNGEAKKSSLEAAYYGAEMAKMLGNKATGIVLGAMAPEQIQNIGKYGIDHIIHIDNARLNDGLIMAHAASISQIAKDGNFTEIIFAKSSLGDAVAARVSAALQAGLAANVVDLPNLSNGFVVKKSIYTGKAFANCTLNSTVKILTLKKNAIAVSETNLTVTVDKKEVNLAESAFETKITGTYKSTGGVSLPEADLVVSAGRGLKGPENWGIVEELATALGAATACSKPVSDLDWRPHHEHVGQTGVKVAPNLYIACGISGAIQHLAGVNSSKVIVVINKDPEAPFFKAADYGIVGDVFEVLPKLTKAIKAL